MEPGGVGVCFGFLLFLAFAFCAGPILSPVSLNTLQLPGPFSCGGDSSRRLLHTVRLVIALSTEVGLGNRNLSGARPEAIGLVFG